MENSNTRRKYYIDWIRVLAFFLLILFHCAMPFVIFGWEIKNSETSAGLSRLILWLHQWRLPLLFFISGVGIHFSLQRRSVLSFAGERFVRLFIPLLFAMFFTIPLQVYFERLQKGEINISYPDFYPSVWNFIPYPEGTLTWSHMWYVVYLYVFCMLLIPVFGLFKIKLMQRLKEQAETFLSNPLAVLLQLLPLVFYYYTLYLEYPEQMSLLDDWFLFVFSLTLVFYGYLFGGSERFWTMCEKYRWHFLVVAAICITALFYGFWWDFSFPKQQDTRFYMYGLLNSVHIWLLILSILGFARKYLNFNNRFLTFANQAVYPFYILHQTIIVAFGYYVVQWPLHWSLKLVVLVATVFPTLFVLYNWLIKPFKLTGFLFGIKLKKKE